MSNLEKLSLYKKIDKTLLTSIYIFLTIPIMLLSIFWFRWYISIVVVISLIYGLRILIKSIKYKTFDEYRNIFKIRTLSIFMSLLLIINVISGAGGFMFQNWDYHSRNALLHDLINYSWPVKYDFSKQETEKNVINSEKGLLSYYFTWFLPSALVGKITKSFKTASIFSFVWAYLGICAFFYLVFRKLGRTKLLYLCIFLSFAGLDILAKILRSILISDFPLNIDFVSYIDSDILVKFFSTNGFISQWFWVFNQAIPAWIVTMLLLNQFNYKNLGILFALLLPYAPLPALGLLIIIALTVVFKKYDLYNVSIKQTGFRKILKSLISIENLIPLVSILPITLLFMQNKSSFGIIFIRELNSGFKVENLIWAYLIYLVCEVFIFITIINKQNKLSIITLIAILSIIPMFCIGVGYDFGNRVTIPAMVILMIMSINFIENKNTLKYRKVLLITILAFSVITNIIEFNRSILFTYKSVSKDYSRMSDNYKTFNNFTNKECRLFITNFITRYDENNLFNKYMLR